VTIRQFTITALRALRDSRLDVAGGVLVSAFTLAAANFFVRSSVLSRAALALGVAAIVGLAVSDFLLAHSSRRKKRGTRRPPNRHS